MFTFQGTITDAHGITHTNPVFVVRHFNSQCSNELNGSFNAENDDYEVNQSEHLHLNYSIGYWTNQAAKDEGKQMLAFTGANGNQNFYFTPESSYTEASAAVSDIEHHFLGTVLKPSKAGE